MKIQSSAGLGIKTTRVLMKMLMWVGRHCVPECSSPREDPLTIFFYFTNMMIITTPDMLDCTRSVSPSSGLFLHCVTETGLKYRVECRTRTCAGWWETRAIITKRHNKATTEACAVFFFFFFSPDVAAEKGDYALLLFAAVGERKSLFPLHVSCQLLRCVNC